MRIKHSPYEYFALYFKIDAMSYSYWNLHKFYASKQSAILALNRINDKRVLAGGDRLIGKIIWSPSLWAPEEKYIVVYSNENEVY